MTNKTKTWEEIKLPARIAELENAIYNALPSELAPMWALRVLNNTPIGTDLSAVVPKFMIWLLIDKEEGVINLVDTDIAKETIRRVAGLYDKVVRGHTVSDIEWNDTIKPIEISMKYIRPLLQSKGFPFVSAIFATECACWGAKSNIRAFAQNVGYAASWALRANNNTYTGAEIRMSEKLLELLKGGK